VQKRHLQCGSGRPGKRQRQAVQVEHRQAGRQVRGQVPAGVTAEITAGGRQGAGRQAGISRCSVAGEVASNRQVAAGAGVTITSTR